MKSVNNLCSHIKITTTSPPVPNDFGNMIYRTHRQEDRYIVDCADDFTSGGWEQFDTDQDAPYFGVWVNRRTLQVLTYCEGDWCLVECPTAAQYNAEIMSMIKYYREGFVAKVFSDDGSMEIIRQDRNQFLIG